MTDDGSPSVLISEDSDKFEEVLVTEDNLKKLIDESVSAIQCTAKTKKGDPCRNKTLRGKLCWRHKDK